MSRKTTKFCHTFSSFFFSFFLLPSLSLDKQLFDYRKSKRERKPFSTILLRFNGARKTFFRSPRLYHLSMANGTEDHRCTDQTPLGDIWLRRQYFIIFLPATASELRIRRTYFLLSLIRFHPRTAVGIYCMYVYERNFTLSANSFTLHWLRRRDIFFGIVHISSFSKTKCLPEREKKEEKK